MAGVIEPQRISCCVPFCRRTIKYYGSPEWICNDHWRTVPKRMRLVHFRVFRRYKRRFGTAGWWTYPAGSPNRLEALRLKRSSERIWARIKRLAIERAAGI